MDSIYLAKLGTVGAPMFWLNPVDVVLLEGGTLCVLPAMDVTTCMLPVLSPFLPLKYRSGVARPFFFNA